MKADQERCLFCRVVSGDIPARKVYEGDEVIAFEDIHPQAPTHLLVIPREHIASLAEVDDGNKHIIGTVIAKAAEIARTLHLEQEGFRLVNNCGEGAGQTVFHIHFHLLGGRPFKWPPG